VSGTNQNIWHRNIVNGRQDSLPQSDDLLYCPKQKIRKATQRKHFVGSFYTESSSSVIRAFALTQSWSQPSFTGWFNCCVEL